MDATTLIRLEEVDSTNTYVKTHAERMENGQGVYAVAQRSGRGQRGNHWESEPGQNLSFSLLWKPKGGVALRDAFQISMAAALATRDLVVNLLHGTPHPPVTVKWPNDIYIGNEKVAGILIENVISPRPRITQSIIGIGVNINQREFHSPAPNPVSVIRYLGKPVDIHGIAVAMQTVMRAFLPRIPDPGLHELYLRHLWRNDGRLHLWKRLADPSAPAPTAVLSQKASINNETITAENNETITEEDTHDNIDPSIFSASVAGVTPRGDLLLRDADGTLLPPFPFKTVTPVI